MPKPDMKKDEQSSVSNSRIIKNKDRPKKINLSVVKATKTTKSSRVAMSAGLQQVRDGYNRVNIYEIFPALFSGYDKILSEHSARIKQMGFNTIWFNPIFEVNLTSSVKRRIDGVSTELDTPQDKLYWSLSSLYAATYRTYISEKIKDDLGKKVQCYYLLNINNPKSRFLADENDSAIQCVQAFTSYAIGAGLTPIFDLVLKHVSIDSEYFTNEYHPIKKYLAQEKDVRYDDTIAVDYYGDFLTKEEKLYNDMRGVDSNGNLLAGEAANSEKNKVLAKIKYHKEHNTQAWQDYAARIKAIFTELWQDKIDFLIDILGFRGIRVDYVAKINLEILDMAVRYINNKLQAKPYKISKPIIFGEYLGEQEINPLFPRAIELTKLNDDRQCIPFSNFMNCANELEPLIYSNIEQLNVDDFSRSIESRENSNHMLLHGVSRSIMLMRILSSSKENIGGSGITIGAPGTHDRLPLRVKCEQFYEKLHKQSPQLTNDRDKSKKIKRMMEDKYLMATIASDGGVFLMGGDEFGGKTIIRPPFVLKGKEPATDNNKPENPFIVEKHPNFDALEKIVEIKVQDAEFDMQSFIEKANKEISDTINYPPIEKRPICLFVGIERASGEQIFIAMGNFIIPGYNHTLEETSRYVAINRSVEPFEYTSLNENEQKKCVELYRHYKARHVTPVAAEIADRIASLQDQVTKKTAEQYVKQSPALTNANSSTLTPLLNNTCLKNSNNSNHAQQLLPINHLEPTTCLPLYNMQNCKDKAHKRQVDVENHLSSKKNRGSRNIEESTHGEGYDLLFFKSQSEVAILKFKEK